MPISAAAYRIRNRNVTKPSTCSNRPAGLASFAYRLPSCLAAVTLLAACSPQDAEPTDGPPALTAETLGPQTPQPAAAYLAEEPYASAGAALGDRLLMQCRACHTLERGGSHMLGPNLHGVFGRQVAGLDDFGYTAALENAEFVWTPRALDAWLAMPSRFLPGNAMAFGGIRQAEDRVALIASLLRHTADNDADSVPADQQ